MYHFSTEHLLHQHLPRANHDPIIKQRSVIIDGESTHTHTIGYSP